MLLFKLSLVDKNTFSLIIIDPLFILILSAVHPRLFPFCPLTLYIGSAIYNFSTLFFTTNSLSLGSLFCLLNAVDEDDRWLSVINYYCWWYGCIFIKFGKIIVYLYALNIRSVSYCNKDYFCCCYFISFYLILSLFYFKLLFLLLLFLLPYDYSINLLTNCFISINLLLSFIYNWFFKIDVFLCPYTLKFP